MSMTKLPVAFALAFGLFVSAHAQAPAGESAGRTEEHIDLRAGFRVKLPVGLERTDMRSASQMVSWTRRDGGTGAILWTISVNNMRDGGGVSMQKQMEEIAATLKAREGFEIESKTLIKVGDDEAIDIKGKTFTDAAGKTVGKVQWWQRQVWVRHDGKFLTWRITGPAAAEAEMDKVMTGLLESLTLIDARQVRAEREKNLAAGAAWLKGLKPADIARRLKPAAEQWFAITRDDKTIGWAVMSFETDNTTLTARLTLATETDGIASSAYATYNRAEATGTLRVRNPLDQPWKTIEQSDLNQGKLTVVEAGGNRSQTRTKNVPADTFLPMAMVQALPLLVNRDKPVTLSFAVNAPRDPQLDVCTVRVGEPRELTLGDKKIQAIPVDVQQAEDASSDVYWIAPDGTIARVESAGGFHMTRATRTDIIKAFPNAKAE